MAETSYPFSTTDLATELQWSRMARWYALDGVCADDPSSTDLKATSSGMTVSLNPGDADVNAFHYINDAVKNFTVPANGGASTRFDRIFLRSSQSANEVIATYVTGGTSPPVANTDRTDVWDLYNTKVTVPAGATAVTLSDERLFRGHPVDIGSSSFRRDPITGLLRIEDALSGNPKLLVGIGSAWKQIYPGDKYVKSSNPAAFTFNTGGTWQDYANGWSAISVPGVQAGDQLEIYLMASHEVTNGAGGNMGTSFRVSGVGIGASDYSHEVLNNWDDGFTHTDQITLIYDAASSGTAIITPRGRSQGTNKLVRGTLAARIVR